MTLRALVIAVAVILLAGCGGSGSGLFDPIPVTVRVLAPSGKCWTATIGDSREKGCGTKSFDDESTSEWSGADARKQTPGRWRLRLVLVASENGEVKDSSSTTAGHGRVTVAMPFCC